VARAIATTFFALLLVLSACSSEESGGTPSADTFCGAARSASKTCKDPVECDEILANGCAKLDAVVSASALEAARDCLQSGICGAASCLSRAPKSALASNAHRQLAEEFCASCAPSVADCKTAFFQRGKKLPGPFVLPYADEVVDAIRNECTGTTGCQATFIQCVTEVAGRVANEKLDPAVADCVGQGFRNDSSESTGPGGTVQVATCTPENCEGCCRNDKCETGKSTTGCGVGAAGCQICSGQQKCTADGQCREPCSANNCAGCCKGDVCEPGTASGACGGDGDACTACSGSDVCSNKQCIDGSCQATCTNGCCSAAGCQSGTAASACGSGGEGCVDCGFGRQCTSGACVIDPNALWDVYVSFAVLPEKSKSNYNWDTLAGLPDAYLIAYSSEGASTHSGQTLSITDSLYPFWAETPLKGVKASELLSKLSFEVWDEDTLDLDDLIGGCELPVTAAIFDGSLQDFTCAASTRSNPVKLYYRINPHK
jgi:C2 domain